MIGTVAVIFGVLLAVLVVAGRVWLWRDARLTATSVTLVLSSLSSQPAKAFRTKELVGLSVAEADVWLRGKDYDVIRPFKVSGYQVYNEVQHTIQAGNTFEAWIA